MARCDTPLLRNVKFCQKAARQGARFVRLDELPDSSKRELKMLLRTVGSLLNTPKGQILAFYQRFLCEVNPNYSVENDTEHQELSR